jgi:hypothetical protein
MTLVITMLILNCLLQSIFTFFAVFNHGKKLYNRIKNHLRLIKREITHEKKIVEGKVVWVMKSYKKANVNNTFIPATTKLLPSI